MSSLGLTLVGILLSALLVISISKGLRRFSRYPPGPPGYPFIGHTVSVLKKEPYKVLARWGETYGPLMFLRVLRKPIVVINSMEVADDLFNKRSGAFADRPSRMLARVCEYDKALAFLPPGDRLKRTRRQLHDALNARAVPNEYPALEAATRKFILDVLQTPGDLHKHMRFRYTAHILSFTLGYHAQTEDDELVILSEKVGKHAKSMLAPGVRFLAELFPFFRYLPIWAAGRDAAKTLYTYRDDLRALLARSDTYVMQREESPDASRSFLSNLLRPGMSDEERSIAAYSSVSIYAGAADTTISLTTSFFLAMMLNPDAQARAQVEIDRVVGRDRLPTFADRPSLPYTEALVTELLRWAPPIPVTSRVLSRDECYEDYLLPRGSTVIANIWAMLHDETKFPRPQEFRPERFYHQTTRPGCGKEISELRRAVRHVVFGFGRRLCPGKFYADAWLWIAITSILATVKISRPDGQTVPQTEIEDGAIIQLLPFPCKIEPRFDGVFGVASATE